MRVEIVDASALAALYFGEAEGEEVARRLGDAHLAAPALVQFEMSNIAAKKIGRSPAAAALVIARFSDFLQGPLEICDVDHGETLALALTTRLTAYDASYLWLARQRQCGLVTLDRQLARAAADLLP